MRSQFFVLNFNQKNLGAFRRLSKVSFSVTWFLNHLFLYFYENNKEKRNAPLTKLRPQIFLQIFLYENIWIWLDASRLDYQIQVFCVCRCHHFNLFVTCSSLIMKLKDINELAFLTYIEFPLQMSGFFNYSHAAILLVCTEHSFALGCTRRSCKSSEVTSWLRCENSVQQSSSFFFPWSNTQ